MHKWNGRCLLCNIIYALVIIGALNWGLTGLGDLMGRNLNLVNLILGPLPYVESIVYILVGIAALAKLFYSCKYCGFGCGYGCGDCNCGDKCDCKGCDCDQEHDHGHDHHDHSGHDHHH